LLVWLLKTPACQDPTCIQQEVFSGYAQPSCKVAQPLTHSTRFAVSLPRLHSPLQEAERAELERVSNQVAAERDTLEAAATALQEQQQQQGAAAGDLSAREAALEARASALQRQRGALQAAQAAALKQLDSLEASLRSKLEGHQKQVRGADRVTCWMACQNPTLDPKWVALCRVAACDLLTWELAYCVLARCRSCCLGACLTLRSAPQSCLTGRSA
jgi:hypothetical protein